MIGSVFIPLPPDGVGKDYVFSLFVRYVLSSVQILFHDISRSPGQSSQNLQRIFNSPHWWPD